MDLLINGKKALVTGAGRGLGRSIASCLAEEGVDVALVSRTRQDLETFREQYGLNHMGFTYDLLPPNNPTKMFQEVKEKFGLPDIIVHNVGGTLDITDPMCTIEDWQKVYRFNLEIAIEINLLAIPHMKDKNWGKIVHISSIAALENQGTVPYCSIKAALTAYSRSLGKNLASDGINVSSVLPGAVFTEGGYWDFTKQSRPEHVEKYLKERMSIRRFGEPDEIGKIVTFLCSDHASFIVGSAITVDGGQGLCFF
ncbi:MAG: SDR family oxidoreductase [Candidatus Marinimicrobia bacterium]|nr:SDR family oxidoreductase [Candidatus Neomarinimicrobiota bacterium]